jgi:hypothetical protein
MKDFNFMQYQDTLKKLGNLVLKGANDSIKMANNTIFLDLWERALRKNGSFEFTFDSVITVARLKSPDGFMRIINWHISFEDGSFKYYGIVQTKYDFGTREYILVDLKDELSRSVDYKTLGYQKWYGAHYYQIIQPKNSVKEYTLLGWDGGSPTVSRKIIEVLYFNQNGEPSFGKPIFKKGKKMQNRFIIQYNKMANVSLKFDKSSEIIFFDHLTPENQAVEGIYEFYIPDFTFDGFKFKKGNWEFIENLDLRQKKKNNKKFNNPQ